MYRSKGGKEDMDTYLLRSAQLSVDPGLGYTIPPAMSANIVQDDSVPVDPGEEYVTYPHSTPSTAHPVL